MNLGEAKRKALVLMREYTVGGNPVESPDYSKSMDDLANAAQNEIAQKVKIPATYTITGEGTAYGNLLTYAMPSDFISASRVEYVDGDNIYPNANWLYQWLDRKTIGVHNDANGTFKVHYYKRPTQIIPDVANDKANDNLEFEIDPEGQELIPMYIAAQLLIDEDPGRSVNLMNLYYSRLAELHTNDAPIEKTVRNVMGW